MTVRSMAAAALVAAPIVFAPSALAGVIMGEVQRMDAGAGLVDLEHPDGDPFTDLASINVPTVGSFIIVEASVPDVSANTSKASWRAGCRSGVPAA